MNLVMIDVFPTLWSPRNTNLYFANGAKLDLETPRVTSIELSPNNPVLAKSNQHLQMRVVATDADGFTATQKPKKQKLMPLALPLDRRNYVCVDFS